MTLIIFTNQYQCCQIELKLIQRLILEKYHHRLNNFQMKIKTHHCILNSPKQNLN